MNICIVDDHLLMAQSLKRLFEHADPSLDITVYGSPINFLGANFGKWRPDIVITDLLMVEVNGLEMIGRAKAILPDATKYILVTSLHDTGTLEKALQMGVSAYITKDASEGEMLEALEAVKKGNQYLNRSIRDRFFSNMFMNKKETKNYRVSVQEKKVLEAVCNGNTPKEIAYDMHLSIHTVQSYIKNLMRKFEVNRTVDMVSFVKDNALLDIL